MSILYSTQVKVTGGRAGHAQSKDGLLKINLAPPKELGGKGEATNPEQLFAAGYAACFESALRSVAKKQQLNLTDTAILATVTLHSSETEGYYLDVILDVEIQGVDQTVAEDLVKKAHTVCPYSKAVRNNIEVKLKATAK